jgi:hypothetical protein
LSSTSGFSISPSFSAPLARAVTECLHYHRHMKIARLLTMFNISALLANFLGVGRNLPGQRRFLRARIALPSTMQPFRLLAAFENHHAVYLVSFCLCDFFTASQHHFNIKKPPRYSDGALPSLRGKFALSIAKGKVLIDLQGKSVSEAKAQPAKTRQS